MRATRGLGALVRAYLLEAVRSKVSLFWNLAFPVFFLLLFAIIFARSDANALRFLMPGLFTITIISSTFFGISMKMIVDREGGLLRRFRATPVRAITIVMAYAVTVMVIIGVSLLLQASIAVVVFKVSFSGSPMAAAIVVLIALLAFIPLGQIVGSIARDTRSGSAITNMIFFPMMFLSGAALPFFLLPGWVQNVARLLPATYVVEALHNILVRGNGLQSVTIPILVLILTAIVGFGMNGLLFRWESNEPINWRNVGLVIGGLTGVYLIAVTLAPVLLMSEKPPSESTVAKDDNTQAKILRGMTIWDGLGGRIERGRVMIQGDRIVEVGADNDAPLSANAEVEDLTGFYMIPGLIDSHVHLGGSGGGNVDLYEFSPQRQIRDLQVYLALGITSIVSLTDAPKALLALRDAVNRGEMRAPRIFLSGPSITAPGGHPASMFAFVPGLAEQLTRQVATPEAARAAVIEIADMKVDLIKLVLEDGRQWQPVPKLNEAAFRAAVQAAKEKGLRVTVHVGSDADARLAIDAGVDGLQHIPTDLTVETMRMMVEKGITLTPTLAVLDGYRIAFSEDEISNAFVKKWTEPRLLKSLYSPQSWLTRVRQAGTGASNFASRYRNAFEATRQAYQTGVIIIAGSDAGNPATFHGTSLIKELELLVAECGLSPQAALTGATSRAADQLGRHDLGRITPGALADLVVLSADPLQNIESIRKTHAVYFRGEKLDRENLLISSPGSWQP